MDTLSHLLELSLEHRVAQRRLPLQLPAAVLPQVEELEHLLQLHHLPPHTRTDDRYINDRHTLDG